jgi:hypothetical protein
MLQCATKSDDALYEQQVHTPAMLFKSNIKCPYQGPTMAIFTAFDNCSYDFIRREGSMSPRIDGHTA